MREILFRGKAINRPPEGTYRTNYKNGDWVYGLIDCHNDYETTMRNTNGVSGIDIDPETICQFTGLLDKKGNRIFEGDIIKYYKYAFDYEEEKDWDIEVGYIKEENGCFVIDEIYSPDGYNELSCIYVGINYDGEYDKDCIFEVIGNIYDNPELLEG